MNFLRKLGLGNEQEVSEEDVLELTELAPAEEQDNQQEKPVLSATEADNPHVIVDPSFYSGAEPVPMRRALNHHERIDRNPESLVDKIGGGLSKLFRKASDNAGNATKVTRGFLKDAWEHACENKGRVALSAGIGLASSVITPWMAIAAPIVAVGWEGHRHGWRNREGKIDWKRLGTAGAVSTVTVLGGYGIGELAGGLGIDSWFTGNETPAGNVEVPADNVIEMAVPEIPVPEEVLVVPEPTLIDLVGQVDVSAAQADGWNFDWAESVLDNPDASATERAQALKDMAFAASYEDADLQIQLLEMAHEINPENVQIQRDLTFLSG